LESVSVAAPGFKSFARGILRAGVAKIVENAVRWMGAKQAEFCVDRFLSVAWPAL
jgi:hypothetical protein